MLIFWVCVLLLIVAGLGASIFIKNGPSNLEPFAQCLKDKGAVFYGAFWCPHCQNQKAMFGKSEKLLPYVECSLPSKQQNALCNEKGISGYPTWIFADGTEAKGEVSLKDLAAKTSCQLPAETATETATPNASSSEAIQ